MQRRPEAGRRSCVGTLTTAMLSCEQRVIREADGCGGHPSCCGLRRSGLGGHEIVRVPSDAAMRSLAVDRGPAVSARIRASTSSIHPPFLAAARVLEHAANHLPSCPGVLDRAGGGQRRVLLRSIAATRMNPLLFGSRPGLALCALVRDNDLRRTPGALARRQDRRRLGLGPVQAHRHEDRAVRRR